MPARNYRDLIVWKKAFDLTSAVYAETACFPREEKYGITAQLRKACVSIPSNIAEGGGKKILKRIPPLPIHCSRVVKGS
jgi:hypothetical protein